MEPTSTLVEIIKTTPQTSNPLIPSNRFTPLYYQNVLVSPKDFTNRTPITTDSPKSIPSYEYLEKPESVPILILKKAWITPNPRQIVENLFPRDFHSIDMCKTRTFYEFILVDTESIEVSHHKDDEGNIRFFKIKILQVLTPQEWNQPLHNIKPFLRIFDAQQYSYYDYMNAWTKILFVNPEKHSWFIWFKKGISLKCPRLFIK